MSFEEDTTGPVDEPAVEEEETFTPAPFEIDPEPAADPEPETASTSGGAPAAATTAGVPLHELEKQAILETLRSTDGNRTKAAEKLEISIRTLRNKISEYRKQGEEIPGDD